MYQKQHILVTGGGGFLGNAIVQKLVQRGDAVSSFSRHYYPALDSLGVVQIQGDIADRNAVENACREMDIVFHVAAKPGVWGAYSEYYNANVMGTHNVISGCLKHSVTKLIHTSSPGVVFNGRDMEGVNESIPYPVKFHSHYTRTKALAEQAVIKASSETLKTIILRPHLIWGPGDNHLVPRIISRAGRLVRVGFQNKRVDTLYIDNAADAHILAADRLEENHDLSGNVYFITQDEPVPLWDMINNILKAGGCEPVRRALPFRLVWLIGALMESAYRIFKIKKEPLMTRFVAEELATAHWFDISAAKKDLGYQPTVSTEEGLKRLEKWLNINSL